MGHHKDLGVQYLKGHHIIFTYNHKIYCPHWYTSTDRLRVRSKKKSSKNQFKKSVNSVHVLFSWYRHKWLLITISKVHESMNRTFPISISHKTYISFLKYRSQIIFFILQIFQVLGDLSDDAQAKSVFEQVIQRFQRLDVLVGNHAL